MLIVSALGGAAAAAQPSTVRAELCRDRIHVDDIFVGFHNEQGRTVEAVTYQGTIYIPIRNAGEWMGCKVAWDQGAQAIRLTSGGTPFVLADQDAEDATQAEWDHFQEQAANGVELTLRPDIKLYLDGQARSFTNVNGEPVYPAVLDQVAYLPVRNVSEMCGLNVLWMPHVSANGRGEVFLYTPLSQAPKEEILAYRDRIDALMEQLETVLAEYRAADLTADKIAVPQ